MRAWVVDRAGPVVGRSLSLVEQPRPSPGPTELLVRVTVCGVCRTDLHLIEGDLPTHRPRVIPGHEVVGVVEEHGADATLFPVGARVGIAWLRMTCGRCRFCRRGDENLCLDPKFTGWDADGGYADYAVVDHRYAYAIPDAFSDEEAAPLLCAGIIGFRALRRAALPVGGSLGIYGFGASAHLAAQVALAEGARVHVLTRSAPARDLALALGCHSAADTLDGPPEPLDAAVLFAPSGDLVPVALAHLDRGGTLAVAGIHLSDIPPLRYEAHLFHERELRSVTANTRADGLAFLATAGRIGLRVMTTIYPLEAADQAVADLAHGEVRGAPVLRVIDGESRA